MVPDLVLTLDDEPDVPLAVDDDVGLSYTSQEYIPMVYATEQYPGPYVANALFTQQVFGTRAKLMTDDFTVRAINYTEAPNDYGTTVTIGG